MGGLVQLRMVRKGNKLPVAEQKAILIWPWHPTPFNIVNVVARIVSRKYLNGQLLHLIIICSSSPTSIALYLYLFVGWL